jgi:hypothetical protein
LNDAVPDGVNVGTSVFIYGVNVPESNFREADCVLVVDGTKAPADKFNPNLLASPVAPIWAPLLF